MTNAPLLGGKQENDQDARVDKWGSAQADLPHRNEGDK